MIPEARYQKLVDYFHGAGIAKTFGLKMHYDDKHRAVFDLPYNPGLDHALHGTHGGAIATMIDCAGWFAAAPLYETWIATVEFQTRLLEPVAQEDLRAVGWVIRSGKRISFCEMEVRTKNRLIATGSGTFMVTSVGIP